jgi:glycosyltransferase involved in cell wall biosynthesis
MIAPGQRVADEVRDRLRLPAERVHVIHNGVDVAAFAPDADKRARKRTELGLRADEVALLCPARLHPQKNHAGLLRAFAQAELPATVHLFLAGDGRERGALETLAGELGLSRGGDVGRGASG